MSNENLTLDELAIINLARENAKLKKDLAKQIETSEMYSKWYYKEKEENTKLQNEILKLKGTPKTK